MITFQTMIQRLQHYWGEQGCVLLQPYDMEVGAGTFHPGTFLRAIGCEPWRAAYVQPSRRPTDGRYGDNPNRGQHYYQFQVVLKPSPDNIQDLYLDSLRVLGVDPLVHDLRFVEDNWEAPTLASWGVGWEVWQRINIAFVICFYPVDKRNKFNKAVYKVPYLFFIGIKNMWPIFMNHHISLGISFCVAVTGYMAAFVPHINSTIKLLCQLIGQYRS